MTWFDIALALFAVAALVRGWQRGAVQQVLGVAGVVAGLFAGVLIAPHAVERVDPALQSAVAMALVAGCAVLLGIVGELIGARASALAARAHLARPDAALGAAVAVAGTALVAWVIGSLLATGPFPAVARAVQDSRALRALDDVLPDVPAVIARIQGFLADRDFPVVFVNLPPQALPPAELPPDASVRATMAVAGPSTVKIVGPACGAVLEGSGFVASPGVVITNAHVIAGQRAPRVVDSAGSHPATPIAFDPGLDLAVLRVSGLAASPLRLLGDTVPRGHPAAALGFPENGGLTASSAAVSGSFSATGLDIYGRSLVTRDVFALAGTIRPGNSGGPLVSTGTPDVRRGTVVGVIFARSTTSADVGYALTPPAVLRTLRRAEASGAEVSTGPCVG